MRSSEATGQPSELKDKEVDENKINDSTTNSNGPLIIKEKIQKIHTLKVLTMLTDPTIDIGQPLSIGAYIQRKRTTICLDTNEILQ